MSVYGERIDALRTFTAAHKTNSASLVAIMATVAANSITAQNITDINAAIVAIAAAVTAAGSALTRPDIAGYNP